MKTVYKFLMLGALALALVAINATAIFAQDDAATIKTDLYNKFIACYKETDTAKRDACYAIGKDYLDKYEKDNDQYGAFVRKKYDAYTKAKGAEVLAARLNNSIKDPKALNVDEAFASGKDYIAQNPDQIDVPITLASIGFDNAAATTPNDKYNADTINYAKMAIDKIQAGKTSDAYGLYSYAYKTQKYPDGKSNALGYLNYYIGYIMYNRLNQKKEALPYFYKATQVNSGIKNSFLVYRNIGKYYADEFARLDADRVTKVKAASDQDTDETKAIFAMQKGYAERAADAYARAYKLASTDTAASKEVKDALLTVAKQFYGIRYNNDPSKFEGFEAYSAALANKPMVDPGTDVTPVAEPTPTPTTTGATTTGTTTTTTTTTAAPATTTTKPATTAPATTTKPATTTTKPATTKPSTKITSKKTTR